MIIDYCPGCKNPKHLCVCNSGTKKVQSSNIEKIPVFVESFTFRCGNCDKVWTGTLKDAFCPKCSPYKDRVETVLTFLNLKED